MTYSNREKLMEIRRELAVRARLYSERIAGGIMTQEDAERHVNVLLAIANDYERLVDAEEPDLFSERRA